MVWILYGSLFLEINGPWAESMEITSDDGDGTGGNEIGLTDG